MSATTAAPRSGVVAKSGRNRRRNAKWLAIPLSACIALGAYGAWRYTSSSATASITTSTAVISRGTLTTSVAGSGTVATSANRAMSFSVSGTVSEVLVAVGDTVKAGQTLARLDTTELDLAVRQAAANLKSAQAQLAAANGQDATAAELASAESQLAAARAQYNQTITGDATAAAIAAAQAQLASANTNLASLLAGPTDAERASAEAAVRQAELNLQSQRTSLSAAKAKAASQVTTAANNLRDAQDSYSTIYWQNRQAEKAPGELSQSAQDQEAAAQRAVANAEESLRQAELASEQARQDEVIGIEQAENELASAQLELQTLTDGATDAEIASARASVASAESNLAGLQDGATAAELASAQASLDQAQIAFDQLTSPGSASTLASAEAALAQAEVALAEAQLALEQATLVAPFDGVVAEVLLSVGDTASSTSTISVIDPSDLYVELSLSESDVADVAIGQQVELTFDALPDATVVGMVTVIAPTATVTSNVATYPVRVSFDPGDLAIKVGMSTSGAIITEQHADVLLAPTRAIQTQGEQEVVQVQQAPGLAPVTVAVETGLSSDGQTEILSAGEGANLLEGDVLLVTSSSSTSSSESESSSTNILSGLSGAPAGGPPAGGPPSRGN